MRLAIAGLTAALTLVMLASAATSCAQTYPAKPIRYVIPFAPGGGQDLVGRALAATSAKRSPSIPELAAQIKSELQLYSPIIKKSRMKAD